NILRRPRPSFLARASRASGEARCASSVAIELPYGANLRLQPIKREIELEHINPRLAQQPESASFDLSIHQATNALLRQAPRLGDPRHLEAGGFRRDIRVEAAARGGHQIGRDRRGRVFLSEPIHVTLHAVAERLAGGAEV